MLSQILHKKLEILRRLFVIVSIFISFPVFAQDAGFSLSEVGFHQTMQGNPLIQKFIRQIENRRGGWIALKANLTLYFLTADYKTASCRGELSYQRLDEKILLKGFNARDQLLFVFETKDRQFELYLPERKTLFHGNIFDLEESPNIDSFVKPLDLYRALKPLAIPFDHTEIESSDEGSMTLKIYGQKHHEPYVFRRLFATKEGDVQIETYYSFNGKPATVIRRSQFKKVHANDSEKSGKVIFPHRIAIERMATENPNSLLKPHKTETILQFGEIQFLPSLENRELSFSLPLGTQVVPLQEDRTQN